MDQVSGFYTLTFTAEGIPENFFTQTEAYLVLLNGRFEGISRGGTRWSGVYRLDRDYVIFDLSITADDADANAFLFDDAGHPSKSPSRFAGVRLQRFSNGTTMLFDGSVTKGPITYNVVGTRVRGMDE